MPVAADPGTASPPATDPQPSTVGALPLDQAQQLLRALGEPIRLQLIEALRGGERCVCELTGELGLAQSKLSFHLKVMKEAGLITARQEGRWIHYRLQPERLEQLQGWLHDLAAGCGQQGNDTRPERGRDADPYRTSDRCRSPQGQRILPLVAVASALLLSSCAPQAGIGERGPRRLLVLTTVAPITLFSRAVAGDCAEVTPLLPPGSDPHAFQSRPQDLLNLRRARLLVINGLGLETFLDRLMRSADNPELRVIDSSRGQPRPQGSSTNPHIWLDPLRAVQQVEAIRDGLIAADPACASGYRSRAAVTISQLRKLHAEIASELSPFAGRRFVVLHDFAPYFAARYGLTSIPLLDAPEQSPAPADLRRVGEAVRRNRIRALLRPPEEASAAFDSLARDLGVGIAPFSSLEALSAAELADPGSYARILRRNVSSLKRAFAP